MDRQLHEAFINVFASDDGKIVLEYLRKRTVDRLPPQPQAGDGVSQAMAMSFRNGEDSLFRMIERMSKKGVLV